MTDNNNGLVWIKNQCSDHEKKGIVSFMCGSVIEWSCRGCRIKQKTNPHYAKHHKYLCEKCQMRGFQ